MKPDFPYFWLKELHALEKVIGTENAYKHMLKVHQDRLDSLNADLSPREEALSFKEECTIYSEIFQHERFIKLLKVRTSDIHSTEEERIRRLLAVFAHRFGYMFTIEDTEFIKQLLWSLDYSDNFTDYRYYLEKYFEYSREEYNQRLKQKEYAFINPMLKSYLPLYSLKDYRKEEK